MKSILNLLSIREYIMGGISLLFAGVVHGQNPIVQTCYTTDPAPMVHDGTLYVYTGHDEDKADFFWMQEWRVYSTKDMVNWTDHGSPLAIEHLIGRMTVPGQPNVLNIMGNSTGMFVCVPS